MLSRMVTSLQRPHGSKATTVTGRRGCGPCPVCVSHILKGLPRPKSAAAMRATKERMLARHRTAVRRAEISVRAARAHAARPGVRPTAAARRLQRARARLQGAKQRLKSAAKHFDATMRATARSRRILSGAVRTYGSGLWRYLARETRRTPTELPLLRRPEHQALKAAIAERFPEGWRLAGVA